jgi:hypothetical protein
MDSSERLGASFLFTDLDLANTFLDIAESNRGAEVRKRNIANAWRAHDAVAELASHVGLTDSELSAILGRLHALRRRLAELENQYPT